METASDFLPALQETEEQFDPAVEARLVFEEAARRLDLEDWIVHRLRQPQREIIVHLPRRPAGGQAGMFTAFRVQHSTARGPALGGLHLRPDAYLAQVKAEAMEKTWQCALLDLPLGGGAGAIVCDPEQLTERELRTLARDYIWALHDVVGCCQNLVAPGDGANEQIMAWMWSAYARARGPLEPGAILGKPAALGAGTVPSDPTGRGLFLLLETILAERGMPLQGLRVSVQGFDKTGAALALLLFEAGARLVAVNDISGGLYREEGLDIAAVRAFVQRAGMLFGYPEAEAVSNAEVLETPCDVLVLAAGEGQLAAQSAGRVQARIVLEASAEAICRAADKILQARDVLVVPDILASAGGTVACFLEWAQSLRWSCWSLGESEAFLKNRLQTAYARASAVALSYNLDLRQAAHLAAVERLAAVLRLR